ncbi:DUF4192 family protein [Streptomyces sp. ET3-23]|uniref:DUF4192 domain-containing protein n=1 Tax=Streptomyces sp. ET3-23 TaxID=2885643 RepID=UPI001D115CA7|nr:DUF4192 domain-containing protein [Streptomyces sp. ET3-23]MCC2280017.1 DUF4192 family protein [Streptomyces sp. ET3-23]
MSNRDETSRPSAASADSSTTPWDPRPETQITLRSPAELADSLPYLMGFHPTDSIVMVALHGDRGRFGGRLRLGIPGSRAEWPEVCDQLAETLVAGSAKRGARPDGIVLFLCRDPGEGETALEVMERLQPLAQCLRVACGSLDVPVFEALCISGGRFWSYCCPDERCCPPEGVPLALPGTSVMAAAAAYAGIQVRGTLREMEARYAPLTGDRAEAQLRALDGAAADLVPRILSGTDCETVRQETLDLVRLLLDRFQEAEPGTQRAAADARDDALIGADEAATIIIGLQDRAARDRAAEWMEGPQAPAALRLWRALARRCVPPYQEHATAPFALAGWVAWSLGDHPEARVALGGALDIDPGYLFAQLLHRACNEGLDPELLRRCLRRERAGRALAAAVEAEADAAGSDRARAGRSGGAGERTGASPAAEKTMTEKSAEGTTAEGKTVAGRTAAEKTLPTRRRRPAATDGPVGPATANGPVGKARPRRRTGQRGARSRQ